MATIGRRLAVAQTGSLKMRGTLAWFAWLFIHLMYIVCFENRLLVLMQWAWNYITFNRYARLITGEGEKLLPDLETPRADAPNERPSRRATTPL
jgi:NADH:ubiquinone reductase (H+-translocating)